MSLEIKDHPASKRIKVIQIKELDLDKLIFPFNKHSIHCNQLGVSFYSWFQIFTAGRQSSIKSTK